MPQTANAFLNPETAFGGRTGIIQIQEEYIFPNFKASFEKMRTNKQCNECRLSEI